jgi:hypothetical protein
VVVLQFFLFNTDLDLALRAERAGIDSIVIDWESKGKEKRQKGHDLERNLDTPEDIRILSNQLKIPVSVRINSVWKNTSAEVETAIASGAGMIMLPMAKRVDEVKRFLSIVGGRTKTIVQVETPELVEVLADFKGLDWDIAYIGLNDLMVASGRSSIWESLSDGTAEKICSSLHGRVYGFGGSTILGGGEPIINILILHEMIRLGASVSVMRRTFKRELLDRDFDAEMKVLRAFVSCSERRGEQARLFDHEHLVRLINKGV